MGIPVARIGMGVAALGLAGAGVMLGRGDHYRTEKSELAARDRQNELKDAVASGALTPAQVRALPETDQYMIREERSTNEDVHKWASVLPTILGYGIAAPSAMAALVFARAEGPIRGLSQGLLGVSMLALGYGVGETIAGIGPHPT